jgi:hypothetical protein
MQEHLHPDCRGQREGSVSVQHAGGHGGTYILIAKDGGRIGQHSVCRRDATFSVQEGRSSAYTLIVGDGGGIGQCSACRRDTAALTS